MFVCVGRFLLNWSAPTILDGSFYVLVRQANLGITKPTKRSDRYAPRLAYEKGGVKITGRKADTFFYERATVTELS